MFSNLLKLISSGSSPTTYIAVALAAAFSILLIMYNSLKADYNAAQVEISTLKVSVSNALGKVEHLNNEIELQKMNSANESQLLKSCYESLDKFNDAAIKIDENMSAIGDSTDVQEYKEISPAQNKAGLDYINSLIDGM